MKRVIFALLSVLVLSGIVSGYSTNISWIPGVDPPWPPTRSPLEPTSADLIYFTLPTSVFESQWHAQQAYGGRPTIIISPGAKSVEVTFRAPPPGGPPPADPSPVCGLRGYFGPLEPGRWWFYVHFQGFLWLDWIDVGEPEPLAAGGFVIEDFERYTDDVAAGEAIFQTWIDGIGYGIPGDPNYIPGNGTGSIVAYPTPPYAEQTIVYGGRQAVRMNYNNALVPGLNEFLDSGTSEIDRYWEIPQDWTAQGVDTLVMYVRGQPNFTQTYQSSENPEIEGNRRYLLSGGGADIWGTSDEFRYAYKRLNGNGSITARVISNGQGSNGWAKGGVMIRERLNSRSKHGMMVITGGEGGGAAFQWRLKDNDNSASTHNPTPPVSPPYWVKIERNSNRLTHSLSKDGVNWWSMKPTLFTNQLWNTEVYIGLCVTSHASGELRTYEFDNVSTTGDVSGQWRVEDIGVEQAGNDAQPLYVRLQDDWGNTGTVVHDDPAIVQVPEWAEWEIDLGDIEGDVDLTKIVKMTIGVGGSISDYPGPKILASTDAQGSIRVDQITAAGPGFGIMMGYVRDSDWIGPPIVPAQVTLFPPGSSNVAGSGTTGTYGNDFYAIFLVRAPYRVKVTASGFQDQEISWSPPYVVTVKDFVMTH